MIEVKQLGLDGVLEIAPKRYGDARGFFSETWNRNHLQAAGIDLDFVQDNHSLSAAPGTLRGLHYQTPPMAQDKLIRVVRGAILDVIVDIRRGSPSYGKWVSIELSAENWKQALVPKGYAHGFITLVADTEVVYKVTEFYSPECDRAIRFDDPDIGVNWPENLKPFELSGKDQAAPFLRDIDPGFV